jgi:tetratricopeptide (TPR) repeat protein
LLDYASHFFQLFPALLVAAITVMPRVRLGALRRPEYLFMLLVLLSSAGLVFIFNPGLGMPRDWDLFSFAGVPLVTLLFYALLDARNAIKDYAVTGGLAITLGLLVLTPRVITQVVPNLSIVVFDNYANLDIIRNASARTILLEYLEKEGRLVEKAARERENNRLFPYDTWDREGRALLREGKVAAAEAKFQQAIGYAPNFAYSWVNLGNCFSRRKVWDSALVCFQIADALNPYNSYTYNSMCDAYMNLGDLDKAQEYCLGAIRLRPANFTARTNLAHIYQERGQREELVKLLMETAELDSVPTRYFFESAD